jgi:hypothetical protein
MTVIKSKRKRARRAGTVPLLTRGATVRRLRINCYGNAALRVSKGTVSFGRETLEDTGPG